MSRRRGTRAPVVLGLLVVVAAGAGSYAWLAASAPPQAASAAQSPTSSAPPGPTAQGTGSTEVPGSGAASPAPGQDLARLDDLVDLVPAALAKTCASVTSAGTGRGPTPGAVAAVECRQAGNTVLYEALPDLEATRGTFASSVASSGVEPGSAGCWDGSPGTAAYTYGQIACHQDATSNTSSITWTYEPANVLASVSGDSGLRALMSWWWFRALLQPAANASGLTREEEALLELLPASLQDTCDHYDPLRDATGYKPVGSLGSIDCFPRSARVADVGFFQFTSANALAAWYDYRVAQADVEPASGGCLDGTAGETSWEHGRILCVVSSGRKAAIRWTDDRYLLYGALNATGKDLASLVRWWRSQRLP